ncbi:MAG: hypothetical protein QOC92_33 [Acidimicrobiaceae bacterium]
MNPARVLHAVGALLIFSALAGSSPASAVGENFGGYSGASAGTGFTAGPSLPALLPVETPIEGTLSLGLTNLGTGGRGFGRASTVWPGTLFVGIRPLIEIASGTRLPLPDYPLVVEQKEYEDAKHNEQPGITMSTDVRPDHAVATAENGAFLIPGLVNVGSIRTVSESVLEAKSITSTVTSTANGINVGVLHIDSVSTTSTAVSDGVTAKCEGIAVVSGARVGDTPVEIDDSGIHAKDSNAAADALLASSGIQARTLGSADGCSGATGSRSTGGLLISVPLPAVPPIPPGGRLNMVFASTTAAAAASLVKSQTATKGPTNPAPTAANVIAHAPGPASGGILSSNPSLPSQTAAIPTRTGTPTSPNTAIGYTFGGVPLVLVLGLFLAAIPGSRRIRRYMERVFTEVLTT